MALNVSHLIDKAEEDMVSHSADRYKLVSLWTGQLQSFQFAKWRIGLKHMTLTVLGIYHPPYSDQSQTTNHDFLD